MSPVVDKVKRREVLIESNDIKVVPVFSVWTGLGSPHNTANSDGQVNELFCLGRKVVELLVSDSESRVGAFVEIELSC